MKCECERELLDEQAIVRAIVSWLETLPWKGPGSLHPGEIGDAIKRGAWKSFFTEEK